MTECVIDLQAIGPALAVGAMVFGVALMIGFLSGAIRIHIGK